MVMMQTRRRFLTALSLAGAASLVRSPPALAAEGALETTTVRLAKTDGLCIAPQYVADELLRAEGFTNVRYVDVPETTTRVEAIARSALDFSANFAAFKVSSNLRNLGGESLTYCFPRVSSLLQRDIHTLPV